MMAAVTGVASTQHERYKDLSSVWRVRGEGGWQRPSLILYHYCLLSHRWVLPEVTLFQHRVYTFPFPRTEDPGAQKIENRETLNMSLEGKATDIFQLAFLILFIGAELVTQFPHSPKVSDVSASDMLVHPGWFKSEHQVLGRSTELMGVRGWGREMKHLLYLHGQSTLSSLPLLPTTPWGLLQFKHSSWAACPHSIYRPLSFLFLRSLPLCLQLLPPPLTTSLVYKPH